MPQRDLDDPDNFIGGTGKNDEVGPGLLDARVVLVEREILRPVQEAAWPNHFGQLSLCLLGDHDVLEQ
jgi:hypothetical protein